MALVALFSIGYIRRCKFTGSQQQQLLQLNISMQLSAIFTIFISGVASTRCRYGISRQRQFQIASGFATKLTDCEKVYVNAICTKFLQRRLYIHNQTLQSVCLRSRSMLRMDHHVGQFKNYGKSDVAYQMFN